VPVSRPETKHGGLLVNLGPTVDTPRGPSRGAVRLGALGAPATRKIRGVWISHDKGMFVPDLCPLVFCFPFRVLVWVGTKSDRFLASFCFP